MLISTNLSRRQLSAIGLAAAIACAAMPLRAATDTETGANGANGNNGIVLMNKPNPGGSGGTGADATATAISTDSGGNTATAAGGSGGNGGNGTTFGKMISGGGNGGNGGMATASAGGAASNFENFPTPNTAQATGGNGGNGGHGGNNTGSGGAGGAGGTAAVSENASGGVGSEADVQGFDFQATSIGGNGGSGSPRGGAGGNGGSGLIGSIALTSGIAYQLEADGYGGSGGAGDVGGAGGNGAGESLSDVFSVPQPVVSDISGKFIQLAQAGNSGGGSGASAGLAGTASSDLNFTTQGYEFLTAQSTANGGNGGDSSNTTGSDGGIANGSAAITTDSILIVTALGNGGTGSDINGGTGTGGAGGFSTASADLQRTTGGESGGVVGFVGVNATVTSHGGTGGSVLNGATGNGGGGGSSLGACTASNAMTDGDTFTVRSAGGNGGQGEGAGFAGGDGGTPEFGTINATAAGGPVTVTGLLIGGDGGSGVSGAVGGNGASNTAIDNVRGSTPGTLTLSQTAVAGSSGGSDGAGAGLAGNATSSLKLTENGQQLFAGTSEAIGGFGGDMQNGSGGNGGSANAIINLTGNTLVNSTANANVTITGHGSNIPSGLSGFTAGNGGAGTANATGTSTGASVGASAVTVSAIANGQTGGNIDPSIAGNGGAGGAANAISTASGVGPDLVQSSTTATGGAGGQGEGFGFTSGNGGSATASASANATIGPSIATARAVGGTGAGTPPAAANAASSAASTIQATADATATGTSGTINTTARGNATGLISFIQVNAIAPTDTTGSSNSESQALLAQTAPTFSTASSIHSAAYAVGNPQSGDVTNDWAPDANVRNAFNNNAANVTALMLEKTQAGAAGFPNTHSTVLELNENNAQLTSNGLIVGMLAASLSNGGISPGDSLRFRVQRNGIILADQTFTTNIAALNYFQNSALDLGAQNAGLNGANLDLQLLFDFTGNQVAGTGFGVQFLIGTTAASQVGTWNNAGGGSWATSGNWTSNTLPDGPGTTATFGGIITAAKTVTLDENTTIGSIQFNNPFSYNIAPGTGGYSLTLDNAGIAAGLTVSNGNHTISAPIVLTSPGIGANIASGDVLTLAGKISGTGALTLTNGGTLRLGTGIGEVDLTSLSIAPGATLDLNNNHIFINYGSGPDPISSIAAWIESGYAGGAWTGSGITSTQAQTNALSYGIGYADSADPGNPAGLATGQIEIAYTLLGDANLDDKVNGTDFNILAANFNTGGDSWDQGDFNYDGKVNGSDFNLLAVNFNQGATQSATDALDAFTTANGLMADVPEPSGMGLALIAAFGAISRRRRKANVVSN